jgi:mersacidin/lichenicidin family type 2 lantibiotic
MEISNEMVVRAWKDPKFRAQFAGELPKSPVGDAVADLKQLASENFVTTPVCTVANCTITMCTTVADCTSHTCVADMASYY